MDLNSHLTEYAEEKEHTYTQDELRELISLIDLTTLNPDDNENNIISLCQKATSSLGKVAAICVYPQFVSIVKQQVNHSSIHIASVANFPSGQEKLATALQEIEHAISAGANEIDIVFPYPDYINGQQEVAFNYITECKRACGNAILKVILETSEFPNVEQLYSLSLKVINLGANFIKTSTGKSKQGATIEAASVMLLAIKAAQNPAVGFKASGGIKTVAQAFSYIRLAKKIMGAQWVKPDHFRIGASSLLDQCLNSA